MGKARYSWPRERKSAGSGVTENSSRTLCYNNMNDLDSALSLAKKQLRMRRGTHLIHEKYRFTSLKKPLKFDATTHRRSLNMNCSALKPRKLMNMSVNEIVRSFEKPHKTKRLREYKRDAVKLLSSRVQVFLKKHFFIWKMRVGGYAVHMPRKGLWADEHRDWFRPLKRGQGRPQRSLPR